MTIPCTLIPGDGIGPDITDATVRILEAAGAPFAWDRQVAGMAAVTVANNPMPDATLESIRRTKLALKGPLETPVGEGFRSVNVALRKSFDLYANVRPVRDLIPGGRFDNVDIVVVRENTEGLYAGIEHYIKVGEDEKAAAQSIALITRIGSERIIRYAFEYAIRHNRKKITLVHKANILKYSSLPQHRPEIARSTRPRRVRRPDHRRLCDAAGDEAETFDVIVTTNMFGDILSDLISGLVGAWGSHRLQHRQACGNFGGARHGTDIADRGGKSSALLFAAPDARLRR
jgi:isocitrate dehydrogenase (NAD+)